jgi:dihydropteroate synthase
MTTLRHATGVLDLSTPRIMGVVNASPESFSDNRELANAGLNQRVEHALSLVADGAHVLDIGGQSARTDQAEIPVEVEVERVVPLIEAIRASSDVVISVDTYRPLVAQAALEAGASIINDVSGLAHPDLARCAAGAGAGFIVMHTRLKPKVRLKPTDAFYADADAVRADVMTFLIERMGVLTDYGISRSHIIVDPGPDFAKTPAQTVAALQGLGQLATLGAPILLALSRKDFVGAATNQPPRGRAAGTLAAIGYAIERAPSSLLRVHDVAATRDFLSVYEVLKGERQLEWNVPLADHLRYDRPSP